MKMQKSNTSGTGSEDTGPKSLKDLLSAGIAQKCTFSTTDESGTSEGVTYVSGGKVRADFSSTVEGKVVKSHMISDGKTNYIWTDGEKTGFKMTVEQTSTTESDVPSSSTDTSVSSQVDLNEKADYKCSAWIADDSLFTPPSDVEFQDFSDIFKPQPSTSAGSGTSQCAYCSSLSGEDKTQCLTALNCN